MRVPIAIIAWLLLTGCGAQAAPGSSPSGQPQAKTVSVHTTGGIAGVADTLTVAPKGAWSQTTRSATRSGQLTTAQVDQLQELASDPRLATEAGRSTQPTKCRDAFNRTVTVDSLQIRYVDCPDDGNLPQATAAIVAYLSEIIS